MNQSAGIRYLFENLARDTPAIVEFCEQRVIAEVPEYLEETDLSANMVRSLAGFYAPMLGTDFTTEPVAETRARIERRMGRGLELIETLRAFTIVHAEVGIWVVQQTNHPGKPVSIDEAVVFLRMWDQYVEDFRHELIGIFQSITRRQIIGDVIERRQLLDDLLAGEVDSQSIERSLEGLGFDVGPRAFVLRLRVFNASPTPAQDLSQSVTNRLESLVMSSGQAKPFTATTENEIIAIGWAREGRDFNYEPIEKLVRLYPNINLRCGGSLPFSDYGEFRAAHSEALEALQLTSQDTPVISFATYTPFDLFLVKAPKRTLELASPKLLEVLSEDSAYTRELIDTIDEYLRSGMNAGRTAERLHIHTNTVYYRLSRIKHLFNIDTDHFWELLNLLIIVRIFGGSGARHD